MGHTPYEQILTTPDERVRGIIDMALSIESLLRNEPEGIDRRILQRLGAIQALAMTFHDDPRSLYAEMPLSITGDHWDFFKPVQFGDWVRNPRKGLEPS